MKDETVHYGIAVFIGMLIGLVLAPIGILLIIFLVGLLSGLSAMCAI